MPERVREETAHEPSDASARLILGLAALVAMTVIAAVTILSFAYRSALSPPSQGPLALPPKPRLVIDEPAHLRRFEAEEKKRLDSWGWVDRRRGIVHIPIAEAMKRAAAHGFADWPGNRQ
jgi:hypothetical protein